MTTQLKNYRSVTITRICMKLVGFWRVDTEREQRLLRIVFVYAIFAVCFATTVEVVDLYHCILSRDFYAIAYNLCATLVVTLILVKLGSFMFYRDLAMYLIGYAETNFWGVTYDEVGSQIMKEYDELGMTMTYTFTFLVSSAALNYIFGPFFEIYGSNNNGTRVLPFKLWMEFPYRSPYYEIAYTIQSLSTLHSGICIFCFDNFVSTFNLHVAAQLKILAHRMKIIVKENVDNLEEKPLSDVDIIAPTLKKLKECVEQHITLIRYVEDMHRLFTILLLSQLLLSSSTICFSGFQLLAAKAFAKKFAFFFHFMGNVTQLFIYTWTCNDIIIQSTAISDAVFNAKWYLLPSIGSGISLRKGLIMIMMRARRPCVLTAGHFAVMSLDTFVGILSTAMSYFTILLQMSEDL